MCDISRAMSRSSYLLIVTGASRGFGRALCVQFAKSILGPLNCVLVGRSLVDMEATVSEMQSVRTECSELTYEIIVGDLEDSGSVEGLARQLFQRSYDYTKIVYVNNAGSLGPLGRIDTGLDMDQFSRTIQLNVTTPCLLLSTLLKALRDCSTPARSIVIVNVTSLWAIEATSTFGAYCSSKAAMEMFFEVAAAEYSQDTRVKFLNYAPGPLDTVMQGRIRDDPGVLKAVKDSCVSLLHTGNLVAPEVSAHKCVRLAIEELFRSGDHVDYYDQVEGIEYSRKSPTTCCQNPNCQCGPACSCSPDIGAQCGACRSFLLENR